MMFGYKAATGNSSDYWWGKVDGHDYKFIRMAVGLSTPKLDRAMGCAVLMGELHRPSGAQAFKALDAHVGEWVFIENWLVYQRKQSQFGYLICEPKTDPTELFFQMHQLAYAVDEIPLIPLEAPPYAVSEFARQKVDQMIGDGRLDLSKIMNKLEHQQEDGAVAIQSAIIWMDENKPVYQAAKRGPVKYRRIMGELR